MSSNRRKFLAQSAGFAAVGSMSQLIASAALARGGRGHGRGGRRRGACSGRRRHQFAGYGPLVADAKGLVDLPDGFSYEVVSVENTPLSNPERNGLVACNHDGMAAFDGPCGDIYLVRNHEVSKKDVDRDGKTPVKHVPGLVYDPAAVGGCTTLRFNRHLELMSHEVSLAGTLDNCAGGPTPWGTWLSCEETLDTLDKPHGYVFEVCPELGGHPEPIVAMGRFEHEAVAFGRRGEAYLTEDADTPFGCFYRFIPNDPFGGAGSLHRGGRLAAMKVVGLEPGTDLSALQDTALAHRVVWIDIPNVDPSDDEASVREQALSLGATPIQKCEGTWTSPDGNIYFVGSRGDGPDAEDEEDRSSAVHGGQVWRYDPRSRSIELVVIFKPSDPWDGPDNITIAPHGFAMVCTDGEDDQYLMMINDAGEVFPFAQNVDNEEEFAGATFSPDGETLFVNIQGDIEEDAPGQTLVIRGPWQTRGHRRHWR